jgi:hypothetical protein
MVCAVTGGIDQTAMTAIPITSLNDGQVVFTSKETCVEGNLDKNTQKRRGDHNAAHHQESVSVRQGAETH